jgi:hypothetical protein
MKLLSYALLAAGLLAPALGAQDKEKDKAKDKAGETPYYPLAVGNTWHYRAGENRFAMRVARHEKVGDAMTARIEMLVEGKARSHENVGVTGDGIYRYSYEGKEAKPPVRFFKLPPKKGDTWTVDSKWGTETIKGTFKTGEETVTVPAGKYETFTASCDKFTAGDTEISVTYYFAQNVGVVKQVIEASGQRIVIELEKFEPAGKKQ